MKIRFLLLSTVFFLVCPTILEASPIRKGAVEGSFYQGSKEVLTRNVDSYIDQAKVAPPAKSLFGLIAPHAGYIYSGPIAGFSYKLLECYKDDFETVVLLGVNHKVRDFWQNSVFLGKGYATPLGIMPVNEELVQRLLSYPEIVFSPKVHEKEHSLEVQIPFLQRVGNFKMVPLIISDYSEANCKRIAEILGKELIDRKEKVVFVASTDFSHYHPYAIANKMDNEAIQHIMDLNFASFIARHNSKDIELCGYGPVLTLMYMAKSLGYKDIELLKYANSGDTAGSKSEVVGYAAIAFYKNEEKTVNIKKDKKTMEEKEAYTQEEKDFLLKVARETVESYIKEGKVPSFEADNPKYKEERGAFVTLHKQGVLRGCIGYIEPVAPLLDTIVENAVNACSKDYRFSKVTVDELKDLHIEISILSIPEKISSYKDIVIGKHGVILAKGGRRSVFLPQVAPEQGWDVETTLMHLAMKAGLPADAWKKGADLSVFTATVFGEKEE